MANFQVCARNLRPIHASIVSYGRSSTIEDENLNKKTTLYVIRVTQSRRSVDFSTDATDGGSQINHWFVARRYSEFRALYEQIQFVVAKSKTTKRNTACPYCEALAQFHRNFTFPQRFLFGWKYFNKIKRKFDAERMRRLNEYLQDLIEITQGLVTVGNSMQEGAFSWSWYMIKQSQTGDGTIECPGEDGSGCVAVRLIRDFLFASEHAQMDERLTESASSEPIDIAHHRRLSSCSSTTSCAPSPARKREARNQLFSSSWQQSLTSFSAHEFDVIYQENRTSKQNDTNQYDRKSSGPEIDIDLIFANPLQSLPMPSPERMIIHRQQSNSNTRRGIRQSLLHRRASSLL